MALKVFSNVKQIISGQVPNASNLAQGELAFGKITEDQKYHLYANSGGAIVDLVQEGIKGAVTLEDVLTAGNESSKSFTLKVESDYLDTISISPSNVTLKSTEGGYDLSTEIYPGTIDVINRDNEESLPVRISCQHGFIDQGYSVLSANPDRSLMLDEQKTVRDKIDVYSKAEVDALLQALQTQFNEHLSNAKAHPDMDVSDAVVSSASEAGFQQ